MSEIEDIKNFAIKMTLTFQKEVEKDIPAFQKLDNTHAINIRKSMKKVFDKMEKNTRSIRDRDVSIWNTREQDSRDRQYWTALAIDKKIQIAFEGLIETLTGINIEKLKINKECIDKHLKTGVIIQYPGDMCFIFMAPKDFDDLKVPVSELVFNEELRTYQLWLLEEDSALTDWDILYPEFYKDFKHLKKEDIEGIFDKMSGPTERTLAEYYKRFFYCVPLAGISGELAECFEGYEQIKSKL